MYAGSRLDALDGADVEKFRSLYRQHSRRVLALLRRRTTSVADAEELAQEVFLRVWRSIDRLDNDRDPWPWIRRIAINTTIDHYRWGPRRREVLTVDDEQVIDLRDVDHCAVVEQQWELQDLATAWADLSEREQQMLSRQVSGASYRELATEFATTIDGIKGELKRTRSRLRVGIERLRDGVGGWLFPWLRRLEGHV